MRLYPRLARGTLALVSGCAIIYLGDRVLGVDLELFWGLETFNLLWFLDLFVVPESAVIDTGERSIVFVQMTFVS